MKKQIITLIILALLPLVASADAVEIGGIYYNLVSKAQVAEVTNKPNNYSGDIIIPEKVIYKGIEYCVNSIGERAFSGAWDMTSVSIPNSITTIGDFAFCGCSGLTSISIPEGVESIGFESFSNCSNVNTLTIANSVTSIGYAAFAGLGITSVIIPNNITFLNGTFYGCTKLTSVIIPDNVEGLDATFYSCSGLSTVIIGKNVKSIGHATFYGCSSLTSVTIPNSVTYISNEAFSGCSSLNSVTIPNSVNGIDGDAFKNCSSLTSVTIGNAVNRINGSVFASCRELLDVYCYAADVPKTSMNAFADSYPESITLYVPESAMENYKTTSPWSSFKNYVALPNYKLTYIVDGEVYKTFKYEEDRKVPVEPAPEKEGYTFSGWSEIPDTMPDHDVEVTGTFTVNKYNLIYMVDGEEYKTVEIEYGAEITPEDGPEKEGYTFMGWSEIPETMPANDVTVSGTFVKNSLGKCATPTIAFKDGKFKFESMEEGVEFVWSITIADSKEGRGNEVDINGIYKVSVYATKADYEDSDAATIEVDIRGKQGDVSGDGEVDATDITKLIDILLKKSATTNTEQ